MSPSRQHVLIAGGGVGGLETTLALRALAQDRVAVTLIADENHFTYRPLAVGVPFDGASTVRVELAAIAEDLGFEHLRDRVTGADLDRRLLLAEDAGPLSYDHLVLALGAVQEPAVAGAITFRGPQDVARLRAALGTLEDREGGHVVFVVRSATDWTLPLYELALLTTSWAARREVPLRVSLVTAERQPLEAFGPQVSGEVRELLARHRIDLYLRSIADRVVDGALEIPIEGRLEADLFVALPVLVGKPVPGLPHDELGFVPVDEWCRVQGSSDAHAIGDMTTNMPRQGGLAAQQADVAAASIAAAVGAPIQPEPYSPALRAVLFNGGRPRFLQPDPRTDAGEPLDEYSTDPWWPPHKIAGRHLAPYLATHTHFLEPVA